MVYFVGLAVVAALAAGLYFKKEETVSFLKSVWLWGAGVAAAVAQYFGYVDFASWF